MNSITGHDAAFDPKPNVLVNRDFALLWLGQSLSVLGDFIFETTLIVWITTELARGQSWAALAVSGVLIASAVPVLVVGPVAGVFVDRWDKRGTMLRVDALSALLMLALLPATGVAPLPFLPESTLPTPWRLAAIYVVVFLASVCAQFFRPASLVLLGDIVPEERRTRAASLNQTSASIAMLLGPPLAAPLLIAFGAQWALLINAGSFVASFLAVFAINAPRPETDAAPSVAAHVLQDLATGLRFFKRSRVLVTLAVSLVALMFGAGALNALDVFFVTDNLRTPAQYFGIVGAAQGAGMVIGAVLAGVYAQRIGLARMLWLALLALGVLTVVYARLTSFVPAVALTFVHGLVIPAISVAIGPIILASTPREFVGRVSATLNPLGNAASISGTLLGGFLYSSALHDFHGTLYGIQFGPLDTIYIGVGILCMLGGLYAMANLRGEAQTPGPATEP
jgi:MFS family permease